MKRTGLKIAAAVAICLIAAVAAIMIGSVCITPTEIAAVLRHRIFGQALPDGISASAEAIIINMRLPRVILAFLVGAAVSAGGAVVQSVLKNPLASPFTLGVSSGAAFGAAIVIAFGISLPLLENLTLAATGLLFAVATVILSLAFARRIDRSLESGTIVLVGMVLSLFLNAVMTMIAGLSGDKYEIIMRWQSGSFSARGSDCIPIMLVVVLAGTALFMRYSGELDILTFGDEQAMSMGVRVVRLKWILLGTAAVLTGCAVAFAGVIGFVDLVAPHIARKIFSPKHKLSVPMSAVIGGTLMIVADLAARTVLSPKELPVGAVTALIGAPFFAFVFFKGRRRV